jgi:hypothetical protein
MTAAPAAVIAGTGRYWYRVGFIGDASGKGGYVTNHST